MPKCYLYADEAGCMAFERNGKASNYFILCTVSLGPKGMGIGQRLYELRHELLWAGHELGDDFHATADKQAVRDAVFAAMEPFDFKVQATICEKSKAQPHIRTTKARFYRTPWFHHFKNGLAPHLETDSDLLVTGASIGSKKEKIAFRGALEGAVSAASAKGRIAFDFRLAKSDPCLQVADYCAWAIQRKWERNDTRSYDLISHRITREYDLWQYGQTHYY